MRNKLKTIHFVLATFFVITLCVSCASNSGVEVGGVKPKKFTQEKFDEAISKGDMTDAFAMTLGKKYANNDIIIQKMDIAMMSHYTKDYVSSSRYFNSVNEDIKNAVTQSLAKGAIAALGNENAKEYSGSIYESHFLNVFNAFNYYNRGDLESAVALMKDLAQKRVMYDMVALAVANESDEEAEKEASADANSKLSTRAAASSINVDMNAINRRSPRKPTEEDVFSDSALERYVALNFYKMQTLDRTTPIEVQGIAEQEIEQQGKLFKERCLAYDVNSDINIPEGMGRVNVLAFSGLIGRRREHATYFPGDFIDGMDFVPPVTIDEITVPAFRLKFVFPEFERKAKKIQRVTALIGEKEIELNLLEDFDSAVEKDVNTKAYKAFKRSVFRSILKKTVAVTAGAASISAASKNGELSRLAATLAASVAIDATDLAETADIRQVMALPSSANAGGINLEAGTYPVSVRYFGANGNLIAEESLGTVNVKAGKLVLMESLCIR